MPSITVVIPYLGPWPVWMPAFLQSAAANHGITWLLLSDHPLETGAPNIRHVRTSRAELEQRFSDTLGLRISLARGFKLCDLRPTFGEAFRDELKSAEWWGHADLDIVWGDVLRFIAPEAWSANVISSRAGKTAGHFTLYRNTPEVTALYREAPYWRVYVASEAFAYFDEVGMSEVIERLKVPAYWPGLAFNFPQHVRRRLQPSVIPPCRNGWRWERGKLWHAATESEVMYLHFMTWKRALQSCDVHPHHFWISHSHIHPSPDFRPQHGLRAWARAMRPVARRLVPV